MAWNFSPLEVYERRVRERLSDEFIYRRPLSLPQLMNLILKGELPEPDIVDISRDLPRRRGELSFLGPEEIRNVLIEDYPQLANRIDNFLGLDKDSWIGTIREGSERYFLNVPVEGISKYIREDLSFPEQRAEIGRQILENFSIRKYKLRGSFRWNLEDFYDKLNITSKCRQIVMVKPVENRAVYKLSNQFSEPVSAYHSRVSLIGMSSREKKLTNYIALTISKYERSKDVAIVLIEEIPSRQRTGIPELRVTVEIPGEKKIGEMETDGAYGTTVLSYLHDSISDPELLDIVKSIRYSIFDVQLFSRAYDLEAIRQYLLDLSVHPVFHRVIFPQHRNKADDQKFIFRDLSEDDLIPGTKKVMVDIQSKGVVFQTLQRADLFDIYDLLGILFAYASKRGPVNILGIPGEDKTLKPILGTETGEGILRMDVIEKTGEGEFILREAVFFDSNYTDVCNKPNEKDVVRGEDLVEDFGYFPPEGLVRKIESEGVFSFPKYESQRIKVKLNYKSGGKDYILGKRKIPKMVRDTMASRGNYAFIFDFFPCKREGRGLGFSDWSTSGIFGEDVKADYILDENKDEISPGRFARVQLNFFEAIKTSGMQILRTGVRESHISFIEAALFASGISREWFGTWLKQDSQRGVISAASVQFPDLSEKEFFEKIDDMMETFAESKYMIRLVEEYVNLNIVVMEYSERGLDYALYESPHGVHSPNVFEHLSRNMGRGTAILLRRPYEFLPDQYDIVVEMSSDMRTIGKTFSTARVMEFLRGKISLLDIDVFATGTSDSTSLIDLYTVQRLSIPGVGERNQVGDSTGMRSATTYVSENVIFPCFHLDPQIPDPNLPAKPLYEFLLQDRPPIYEIFKRESPWRGYEVTGVGVTKLFHREFVTSVYMNVLSRPLCILTKPTPRDETIRKLFVGKPELETPDPYIENQFRGEGYRFNDVLFRRGFGAILVKLLMKVLFVEFVERLKRYGPVFDRTWRNSLLQLVTGDSSAKNLETIELTTFYLMIKDVKSLRGYLPQNPIRALESKEYLGRFFSGGSIRCFSKPMYEKLNSQIVLLERILPTVPELYGIGGVPKIIYRTDVYNTTTILSESPQSVTGILTDLKAPDQYSLWQTRCQTSLDKVTLYNSILPEFFDSPFTASPLIGFYGSRGTGLWSVRPPGNEYDRESGVIKVSTKLGSRADVPKISYIGGNETLLIGAHDDDEDKRVLIMEKII